jgi:glyceraldehyde 3-phosphate dehydrogenase
MAIKVAINGFGRIGRLLFRKLADSGDFEVVGINDIANWDSLLYLLKYDSVHRKFPFPFEKQGNSLVVRGRKTELVNCKAVAELPWGKLGAEIVFESTGVLKKAADAKQHINPAGAKRVIITAPANDADMTLVVGVNLNQYDPAKHFVVSNASCTTNCVAPVVKVILDNFGIETAAFTTVHAYTADQRLVDLPHSKLRRGRAAAMSIVPTTTGAAEAIEPVLPAMKGKAMGVALRVPVVDGSITEFIIRTEKPVTKDIVNRALKDAANGSLKGVLEFCEDEIVSSDVIGNSHSSIVDAVSTQVVKDNMIQILSWYDNEWGYVSRCMDLAKYIISR